MFKDIEGYEGLYKVNEKGEVWSVKNNILLKSSNKAGYLYVSLYKNKKRKEVSIHSIVLKTFSDKKEWKELPNHKDFNTHNNNLDNLEWVTQKENVRHTFKHKGYKAPIGLEKAKEIREFYCTSNLSELEVSKIFNISRQCVNSIVQNKSYYDENYKPPNRKFKNGYSEEFLIMLKDMYYVYGMKINNISNLLWLNKEFTRGAIKFYNKYLN
jgi:hypothetical protein